MRHLKRGRKLGRTASHRKALRQNLANAVFTHGRIITTMAKAKEVRPFVEKLVTLGKRGVSAKDRGEDAAYLHHYRRAISVLQDKAIAKKLFEEIAPSYRNRPGGYTRIVRDAHNRLGDNAPRAIFELVEFDGTKPEPQKKGKKKK